MSHPVGVTTALSLSLSLHLCIRPCSTRACRGSTTRWRSAAPRWPSRGAARRAAPSAGSASTTTSRRQAPGCKTTDSYNWVVLLNEIVVRFCLGRQKKGHLAHCGELAITHVADWRTRPRMIQKVKGWNVCRVPNLREVQSLSSNCPRKNRGKPQQWLASDTADKL